MKKHLLYTSFFMLLLTTMIALFCPNVEGAIRLNKTKTTLTVGQTIKLTLNTKGSVKWSSANKSVAAVTNNGTVTAKSEGSALIIAVYRKKYYECKVTVQSKKDSTASDQFLSVIFKEVPSGVVAIITNHSPDDYSLTTNLRLIQNNETTKMISAANYYFTHGTSSTFYFEWPKDSNMNYVPYSNYKISFTKNPTKYTNDYSSGIRMKAALTKNNKLKVVMTNRKKEKISYCNVSIIFYQDKVPVGYHSTMLEAFKEQLPKTSFIVNLPLDQNNVPYKITSYDVYLNYAYTYTW